MIEWNPGKPPESGYYLATLVLPSGNVVTSELWFNTGDGIGRWWSGRGYLDERRTSMECVAGVTHWARIPAPAQLDQETITRERSRHIHRMCQYRDGGGPCLSHCVERWRGISIARRP